MQSYGQLPNQQKNALHFAFVKLLYFRFVGYFSNNDTMTYRIVHGKYKINGSDTLIMIKKFGVLLHNFENWCIFVA